MMSKPDAGTARQALPLNAIRVFVEAARQMSFSRAALAMGMTQGGVSRHVASLERFLGHRLFVRAGSSLQLTDAGRLYFDTVQEAQFTIEMATRQLTKRSLDPARLVVRTSLPTFAMTVLIPALPNFRPAPPVLVDVVTSLSAPVPGDIYDVLISRDLELENADHWLLATEELICVAAPAVLRECATKPIDRWPFLAARSRPDALAQWTRQLALTPGDVHVVASFDHYFLALPAAIAGMGCLVVPRCLVLEPLRHGHLVEGPTAAVRGDASYGAFVNPRSSVPEAARTFCRWLKGQLRAGASSDSVSTSRL